MKKITLSLILGLGLGFSAANADTLEFATGAKDKGFSLLYKDIADVCGKKVSLTEVNSEGSLDNVNKLLTKDASIALVQVDVLRNMTTLDDNVKDLRAVMSLNANQLHIVTARNGFTTTVNKEVKFKKYGLIDDVKVEAVQQSFTVSKFSDLKGMPVAVVGSAALTMEKINQVTAFGMNLVSYATDKDAIDALKRNEIAAVFTIAAWPHGGLSKLKDPDLTLVDYDLAPMEPYSVIKKNYANLGAYGVKLLSAPNLLVSRKFQGPKLNDVLALKDCINTNLVNLQEGKFQPAWGEVKTTSELYGITPIK